MSSLRLTVAGARRALTAVNLLTTGQGRDTCTTTDVADLLGIGFRDASVWLAHLEDLDLVTQTGRYERCWLLTGAGAAALEVPEVSA